MQLLNRHGLDFFHHFDVRVWLGDELALGAVIPAGGIPVAVVEADAVPARHLEQGIIVFAVVFVVDADGTASGDLPGLVGADFLLVAVGIGEHEHRPQDGGAIVLDARVAHGNPATVAEDDADGVAALLQLWSDIVGVVEHAVVIVGGAGRELALTDALAVEVGFVEP